jgi:maltooligosyltrehalose trehalohydrolase
MNLMPLQKLGAREITPGVIQFGVFFPWLSSLDGNRVFVKVIHENDQFLQAIQPISFEMAHAFDPTYGDYWSCQVNVPQTSGPAGSTWGQPGTYVYRYEVHSPNAGVLDWIVDPFAREFGTGKLSAFTLGYQDHGWSSSESSWKTPSLNDLIVYELQLEEFATGIDGAIEKITYLADLGVTCLEVMPVSNVAMTVDWGYMPVGYFGVDERFGNRADFQRLVDAAHQHGMAVILDAVYGHTDSSFTYSDLYRRLGYEQNPFLGSFAKDYYGESIDFSHPFTQDFFFSVNYLWLDRFHIDGFRYDCVPEYWDGATGVGYANLVYNTYQIVKAAIPEGGYWQRFGNGNQINLIQCAEQLEDPQGVLNQSYSTATWQDALLGNAQDVAHGNFGALTELGMQMGLMDYPTQLIQNDDILQKTAFQYLENHDHERFVCNFGLENPGEMLLQDGNRSLWYKVQPYLIGLLAAKGVPMLWQGQEFGENYWIPPGGVGRVMLFRPVRWDYFYDDTGKLAISLVRRLIRLRQLLPELRSGDHYFYNQWDLYQSHGLLLFSRISGNRFTLIALNFTDSEQTVPFWFPSSGDYAELLDAYPADTLAGVNAFDQVQLTIPSNYGRIWSLVV